MDYGPAISRTIVSRKWPPHQVSPFELPQDQKALVIIPKRISAKTLHCREQPVC
jgi:hypothetical protein